jgi:hypothetical protein
VRERRDSSRPAGPNPRQQKCRLPIEKLQHVTLKIAISERHTRELAAVDRGRFVVDSPGRTLRHAGILRLCGLLVPRKFDPGATKDG